MLLVLDVGRQSGRQSSYLRLAGRARSCIAAAKLSLWPFDGALESLMTPGAVVVAETYPAECYGWFSSDPLGSKTDRENRKAFGKKFLAWAEANCVVVEDTLNAEMQSGFPKGDDAFDAVVGLFGMLQVALGKRAPGAPDDPAIREVEGRILGRQQQTRV